MTQRIVIERSFLASMLGCTSDIESMVKLAVLDDSTASLVKGGRNE
jgi:hypothetical protein